MSGGSAGARFGYSILAGNALNSASEWTLKLIKNSIQVITIGFEIPTDMGQNYHTNDFFPCVLANSWN